MMSSKIQLESISYLDSQENDKYSSKSKNTPNNNLFKSHRKTTSALVRNAELALNDITNSPPQTISNKSNQNSNIQSITPIKSTTTTSNNISSTPIKNSLAIDTNPKTITLSPKSSRYTIAATPTKPNSNGASPMMTITQYPSSTASPMLSQPSVANGANQTKESLAKSFFTPTKGEKKMKKKQLEKEYQMLQDKVKIMEKIRSETDSDVERMKISLIESLTENDRLQKRVGELEELVESMKTELNKGSYEAWKGYCSLQDSPPGVSTRYSKKRALHSNNSNNL